MSFRYVYGDTIGQQGAAAERAIRDQFDFDKARYFADDASIRGNNSARYAAEAEANRQANLATQYQFNDEAVQRDERRAAQANALGLADRARAQFEFGVKQKTDAERWAEQMKLQRDLGIENKAVKDAAEARRVEERDFNRTAGLLDAAQRGNIPDRTTLDVLMPPDHPAYEATTAQVAQSQAAKMVDYEAGAALAAQLTAELKAKVLGNVLAATWTPDQKAAALAAAIDARRMAWNRRKGADFDKAFAVDMSTGEVTNNLPTPVGQDLIQKFGNKWQSYPNLYEMTPPIPAPRTQTSVAPPVVTPLASPTPTSDYFRNASGGQIARDMLLPAAVSARAIWDGVGWTEQQQAKAQLKAAAQALREAATPPARTNAPSEATPPPGGWPTVYDQNPEDLSTTVRRLRAEQMARTTSDNDLSRYNELMAAMQALRDRNAADVEARNRAPGMGVGRYLPDFATASNAGRRSGVGWSGLLGREDANAIPSLAQYAFMAPEMERGYEANARLNNQMDLAFARRMARIPGGERLMAPANPAGQVGLQEIPIPPRAEYLADDSVQGMYNFFGNPWSPRNILNQAFGDKPDASLGSGASLYFGPKYDWQTAAAR